MLACLKMRPFSFKAFTAIRSHIDAQKSVCGLMLKDFLFRPYPGRKASKQNISYVAMVIHIFDSSITSISNMIMS